MKLTEIAYFANNVAEMAVFYQKLLNVNPIVQSPDMAIFMIGQTRIFIHKTYTPSGGDLPPENHMAFTVEDVDAACLALKAQGLTIEIEPRDFYWGRSAYLRDPEGHLVELTQARDDGP
jgi:catechol 2,3-dioxygenase-like lactoylglutathione lyase family enzyme